MYVDLQHREVLSNTKKKNLVVLYVSWKCPWSWYDTSIKGCSKMETVIYGGKIRAHNWAKPLPY
jgi:hypothetical protein